MSKNNKNKELQNNIKAILLGEAGVGKTSIILRYIQNKFNPSQTSTFGATYLIKDIERGDTICMGYYGAREIPFSYKIICSKCKYCNTGLFY